MIRSEYVPHGAVDHVFRHDAPKVPGITSYHSFKQGRDSQVRTNLASGVVQEASRYLTKACDRLSDAAADERGGLLL